MNTKVWFIIVTYYPDLRRLMGLLNNLSGYPVVMSDNTGQYQISNIPSAKLGTGKYQINPFDKLRASKLNIKYIKTKTNLGYGGGANVGIKEALKNGAKWVVVLNQDLAATRMAINRLVTRLNRLTPGIAGPFAGALEPRRFTTIIPSRQADYITGSCIAIHRDVFEQVGYFYEPYFLYYEEVDLCLRAKKAGFPVIHIPMADISHKESVTLGKGSFLHQYYLARNHLLFVERCVPRSVKLHEGVRLPKTIWEHWRRQEWGALRGVRDYLLRRFGRL